jgi:hypothetical protein
MRECIIQLANISDDDQVKLEKAICDALPDVIITSCSMGHAVTQHGCLVAELSKEMNYPGIEVGIIDNNSEPDVIAVVEHPINGSLRTLAYRADQDEPDVINYRRSKIKKRTLDVLVKDTDGTIGYATIDLNEALEYRAEMYQGRIDTMLLHAKELSDWDVFNSVANSKMFTSEVVTELDALNSILEFWSIDPLVEMPEIIEAPTLIEAINYFRSIHDKYMVCHLYYGTEDKEE